MQPKTYISTTQNSQDLVLTSTKIALVTLAQSSIDNRSDTSELENEIRQYIQSSGLSKRWSIEKITILDDPSPTAKILGAPRQDDLTVP